MLECLDTKLVTVAIAKVDIKIKNVLANRFTTSNLIYSCKKVGGHFSPKAVVLEGTEIFSQCGGATFTYQTFCDSLALFIISFFAEIA